MLDRQTPPAVAALTGAPSLARRRALVAVIAGATIGAVLWLAATAVPPRSASAIAFLALFAATLPWSTIGFWNASIGFLIMCFSRDPVATVNPMAAHIRGDEPITALTAILVCIRNENPSQVIRNLQPLLNGLRTANVGSLFHVYILSDTNDPEILATEVASFSPFVGTWRDAIPVTYRRRPDNTAYKAGNIRDFCDRWSDCHELAVVLDADSFMPAGGVLRLVRIMQANPTLGILQTLVVGLPSVSAFARLFQFGMRLGMRSHTLGAAWWQGDCGPYWGHNAILRLKPFAAHCRLPVLPRGGPLGGYVLSHDQIEAALMRRAGYEVRVIPAEGISWEENPPTLMEFIRRELRWCQGNMQYFRLLGLPGLKPVSRFQLVLAILMYLGSPAWMALLAVGSLAVGLADTSLQAGNGGEARCGCRAVRGHAVDDFCAQDRDRARRAATAIFSRSLRRGRVFRFERRGRDFVFFSVVTSHGVRPHRLSVPSFYFGTRLCMEQTDARKSRGSLVGSLGKALAADSYRLRCHRDHCDEGAWRHRLCAGNRWRLRFVRTLRGSDCFPLGRGTIRANWRRSHPRGS